MPGLFCFQCGYDLCVTPSNQLCPECGHASKDSLTASMLTHDGVKHGTSLKHGLGLLAASLYFIPVIPLIGAGLLFAGTDPLGLSLLVGLLLTFEHVFWALGIWYVCHFADRPEAAQDDRGRAQRARTAAGVCASFAVATVFLVAVGVNASGQPRGPAQA